MITFVFLLEEPSAQELLMGIFPRLVPNANVRYIVFQGKQDLEKNVERKLKGWQVPNSVFIILRDQDSEDCNKVKQNLLKICRKAGKSDALVRIACRELESFYLGDLAAVENGLRIRGIARKQDQNKFRAPDLLEKPSMILKKLTSGTYQKVGGSREIAPLMNLEENRSPSFLALVNGIKKIANS